VLLINNKVNIKIDDIILSKIKSISNYLYRLRKIIKDQGLNYVFSYRDYKKRYFGLLRELIRTRQYI
jgi:hypothetical protein